jgi:NADP-dependent 3-hydroxy acid dehydrogenase YdfG
MDTKASTLAPALLQLVTEMNLFGTVYSCNAVAPIMKQQRSGKIITVSSVAGTAPSADGGEGCCRPLHAVSGAGSRAIRDHRKLYRPRRDRDRADYGDGHSGQHSEQP